MSPASAAEVDNGVASMLEAACIAGPMISGRKTMIDFRSGVTGADRSRAAGVGCGKEVTTGYQGYVEGEYLYLAAPQAGI